MWLCTTLGFFSVVKKGDRWHLRARARDDLENLKHAAKFRMVPITDTPDADYPCRLILTKSEWACALAIIGNTVDYPNFKRAVSYCPSQTTKLGIYAGLWEALRQWQEGTPSPFAEPL